jgi:ABC-2 type transport system ATP-binding protein
MITVTDVVKEYKLFARPKGVLNSLRSIARRQYTVKCAVDHVSFSIKPGEVVGYIGPNGAGKSTTIKMLSGILAPTSGSIVVNNRNPAKERIKNAREIGVVFGQRSQLYWDLPVTDSFILHKKLYDIDTVQFKQNVEKFTDILQMGGFINQAVRQLSLGQRMRANIALSLLHNPRVLYLDEPTIGLDIVAKKRIREFIKEINKTDNTTVILTTHDMGDIEEICSRIIVIDNGKICYDGDLRLFKENFINQFTIAVEIDGPAPIIIPNPLLTVINKKDDTDEDNANKLFFVCNKSQISIADAVTYITAHYKIKDIKILEETIEDILIKMYSEFESDRAGQYRFR